MKLVEVSPFSPLERVNAIWPSFDYFDHDYVSLWVQLNEAQRHIQSES